jgi:hypothetical protein
LVGQGRSPGQLAKPLHQLLTMVLFVLQEGLEKGAILTIPYQ